MLKFLSAPMLLALGLLVQQAPSTPYEPRAGHFPGQTPAGHEAPPDDWYCSATAHDEHHCECSRMVDAETTQRKYGGSQAACEEAGEAPESNKCERWCYVNARAKAWDKDGNPTKFETGWCQCPIHCDTAAPPQGGRGGHTKSE